MSDPLTPRSFGKLYGIGPSKVIGLIEAGEIEAIDVRGHGSTRPRWRIKPEAVEAFEQRRANRPKQAKAPRRRPAAVPSYL